MEHSFRHTRGLLVGLLLLAVGRPAHALPTYARRYNVGCQTCHTIAPRLNTFGYAFQANHLAWPTNSPPPRPKGLLAIPISGIATWSYQDSFTANESSTAFRELELFASQGWLLDGGKGRAGYFVNALAASNEGETPGELEDAFVSFDISGSHGQWAITLGQFSPLQYQYDPVNSLTASLPAALGDAILTRAPRGGLGSVGGGSGSGGGGGPGGYSISSRLHALADEDDEAGDLQAFSFTRPQPGIRVEYFDHRNTGTADGTYVSVGMPFHGQLAFNDEADLSGGAGVYLHAFRRKGYTTLGVFGFTEAGNHLEGVMGTHELLPNLYLTGIASMGHDREGATRRGSVEAEWVALPGRLAFNGRLDVIGGEHNDVAPTAAVTFYPIPKVPYLRLTGELVERKGNRGFFLFGRAQF